MSFHFATRSKVNSLQMSRRATILRFVVMQIVCEYPSLGFYWTEMKKKVPSASSVGGNYMCPTKGATATKGATPIGPCCCPTKQNNGSEGRSKSARDFIEPYSHPIPTEDKPP
jgi:hypothetical protein